MLVYNKCKDCKKYVKISEKEGFCKRYSFKVRSYEHGCLDMDNGGQ